MAARRVSSARAMSWPATSTLPEVGLSSPPSRCSSVLLPTPDGPRMATCSPARISRSTPSRTLRRAPAWAKDLSSPRALMTTSFMTQCLHRLGSGRPPGGINGRQQRQHQRQGAKTRHIAGAQLRRQIADVVHIGRQKIDAEELLDQADHLLDVERQKHAGHYAQKSADDADQRTLHHENGHDATWPNYHGHMKRYIGSLGGSHHEKGRY